MKDVHNESPAHGQQIDTRMIIKVFILFFNDGLAQERRDLLQLRLHPPLLIVCEKSVDHFPTAVFNDGRIFDLVRQGEYPVEEQKKQEADGGCQERPYEYAPDGPFFDLTKHVIQSCPDKGHMLSLLVIRV